jgi:hypothetical protein
MRALMPPQRKARFLEDLHLEKKMKSKSKDL